MECFTKGGFVASIGGRSWHSVAIDECHEMMITKSCKTSIVHPTQDYIHRIASYIPYRNKCLENLRKQLFPEHCTTAVLTSLLTTNPSTQKHHATVEAVKRRINEGLLTAELPALTNPYTEKEVTKQQREDLMNFRETGEKEFEKYVEYNILHKPSTKTPNRKRKLLTFSHRKANKARLNQLERDKQLVMKCLQKRLKWYQQTGKPVEKLAEQYIPFPLAISDNKGNPTENQKSFTTKVFETRYTDSPYPVIMNTIPSNLTPQCVVLEGMFLINTSPLGTHTTFGDYAFFLMRHFILSQFNNRCREVHILLDNPGRLQLPKTFERQ